MMITLLKEMLMYRRSMQIEMRNEKIHNKPKKINQELGITEDLWSPENIAKNREALRRKSCPWEFKGMTQTEWYEEGRRKHYKFGCWGEGTA